MHLYILVLDSNTRVFCSQLNLQGVAKYFKMILLTSGFGLKIFFSSF